MADIKEFTDQQVDEIIKEIMPVLKRTGIEPWHAEAFMAAFLNRIAYSPLSSMGPIQKVLRTMPVDKLYAKRFALDNVCLRAADEIRLLIESDEGASGAEV
jgi:hypothetical protein